MTEVDIAVTSLTAFLVVGLFASIVIAIGAWKLEKKGYSFWGAGIVGVSLIHPLGTIGAALFIFGVSLLAPERRE